MTLATSTLPNDAVVPPFEEDATSFVVLVPLKKLPSVACFFEEGFTASWDTVVRRLIKKAVPEYPFLVVEQL
jgi:hypothetical protein